MADRGRRVSRAAPFKPAVSWGALALTSEVTIGATAKVLLGSFTADLPTTVRRTRGLVSFRTDQTAGSELPFGAFGMCVVSDDAFAAGAASIPGPFTDAFSDLWFVHEFFIAPTRYATVAGQDNSAMIVSIDSKAMRKVGEDETVAVMIENGSAVGAAGLAEIRLLSSGSRG